MGMGMGPDIGSGSGSGSAVRVRLAQLVRSLIANQEVPGSILRPSFATPSVDREVKSLV